MATNQSPQSTKLYGNTIISYSNYYNNRNRSQERTLVNANEVSSTSMSGILEDTTAHKNVFRKPPTTSSGIELMPQEFQYFRKHRLILNLVFRIMLHFILRIQVARRTLQIHPRA